MLQISTVLNILFECNLAIQTIITTSLLHNLRIQSNKSADLHLLDRAERNPVMKPS